MESTKWRDYVIIGKMRVTESNKTIVCYVHFLLKIGLIILVYWVAMYLWRKIISAMNSFYIKPP